MANGTPSKFWPITLAIISVLCLFIALPDSWKTWAPGFLRPDLRLGLDLAGGTQLDFRISEDEIAERTNQISAEIAKLKAEGGGSTEINAKQVELQSIEQQHNNLVEAIRTVLERRINSLGVSEATITPSYFGNEKHLLVECPGVVDVDKCIATVGKTIRLEFKEEWTGESKDYEAQARAKADAVFKSVTTGTGSLQVAGQDLSNQLGVSYADAQPLFVSDLPKGLEPLANRTSKDPIGKFETTVSVTAEDANGQPVLRQIKGIYIAKILEDKKPATRPVQDPKAAYVELAKTPGASLESKTAVSIASAPTEIQQSLQTMAIGTEKSVAFGINEGAALYLSGRVDGGTEMTASHILIQYKGAQRAEESVTRTKAQARTLIDDIAKRLQSGSDFTTIAKNESDGPSKQNSGSLGVIKPGQVSMEFDKVAFALKQDGVSGVVETPFGFHIIRADKAASVTPATVTYDLLKLPGGTAAADAAIAKVEKGEVMKADQQIVVRSLFFSLEPTGWKDTDLNGQRFRSAAVTADPTTNIPVVQIQFDEEGGKMFQELTKRNVGKRIAIFVGGDLVSAPTVQGEIAGGTAVITGSRTFEEAQTLATDLNTGAIPAPIYLSGQTTIEATLGASALSQSVFAAMVGLAVLCLMLIIIYRVLGVVASAALMLYVTLLIAATKLPILLISNQHVVLTLAGIAGMILSMGMAVDANVLAFERVKEELRKGKMLRTAIDTGFKRAWPSVRDGNMSTLITCAILFVVGTSIIRGFAITLAIGIFISLFTAIVVSRWLSQKVASSALGHRPELFGVKTEHSVHHENH